MIFIGTVNVANIVSPDIWRGNPIGEKIAPSSSSGDAGDNRTEGTKDPTIQEQNSN